MSFFAILALFIIALAWQDLVYVFFFSIFIFYAIYRENLSFLKARKLIIKKASIQKNSFFDKLSKGRAYTKILSFCFSISLVCSLLLNLMYANKLDLLFFFLLFPLIFLLFKFLLKSQFKSSSYNIFYFIAFSAFFSALIYAILNVFIKEPLEAFVYLKENIDLYKISSFSFLNFFSQGVHILAVLKNFLLLYFDNLAIEILIFCFDFINSFFSFLALGFLYSFCFRKKAYIFLVLFLGLLLFFVYDDKRNKEKIYQDSLPFIFENIKNANILDENLTYIKENLKHNVHFLKSFKQILEKSALDIGFWWFSAEKKELEKELEKALNEI